MLIQLIQEGGPGAYLAIALGLFGVFFGGVSLLALLGKSRSSFALGIVTLVVAMAAAGAGMVGTAWGRAQTTSAVAYVDSQVDQERIMRVGFRESQSASWIGLFAALLPLMLGAAAAIGGSRIGAPKMRAAAFGDPMAAADDGLGGQTVVAFLFTTLGVIAAGGAWAMAHSELPKLRYGFDEGDSQSWSLARALEEVQKGRQGGCHHLSEALQPFWGATDLREWPRAMRVTISPELAGWRAAADACTKEMIEALADPAREVGGLTQQDLLESPLLQDDALRAQVLAWRSQAAQPDDPGGLGVLGALSGAGATGGVKELNVGAGSLDRAQISGVIKGDLRAIRSCYERELLKSPSLEGKLVVQFTIGKDGKVASATDASMDDFPSKKVSACVLSRFRSMQFPRPLGGGVVTVKYPFVFKAAN